MLRCSDGVRLAFWFVASLAVGGCTALGTGTSGRSGPNFSLDMQLQRADEAFREARLSDAERLYREVADQHPSLTEVWLRLGNIYTRQNALDAATRAYQMALRNNRHEGRAWYNLSIVYLKQSITTLEVAAAELPPDSPYRKSIEAQYAHLLARVQASESAGGRP